MKKKKKSYVLEIIFREKPFNVVILKFKDIMTNIKTSLRNRVTCNLLNGRKYMLTIYLTID